MLFATTKYPRRRFSTSDEMDALRKNYSTYYTVLYWTGLSPYDRTLLTNIQRIAFCLLILAIIVIQVWTLNFVQISVNTIVTALSYSSPLFLYFLRYVGFVVNFPIIKTVFESFDKDCKTIKNPVEMDMLMKHVARARRTIKAYIVVSSGIAVYIIVTILIPTLLQSKLQLHYLRMFGFFYNEGGHEINLVSIQLVLVSVMGLFSIAATESSLAVYSAYFCGLFEIASYRIHTAVNSLASSVTSELIDVQSAVELHQRAIELTGDLSSNLLISYLVAVVGAILSFAINLYRLLLATNNVEDMENLIFSVSLVVLHFIIMFLNNYSGQKLKDTSVEVFNKTYNSLWYCIPPKSQKILLFVLMRSVDEVMFDLAGLFTPCFEGFSMMMSSSFSYFTVIYSTQ